MIKKYNDYTEVNSDWLDSIPVSWEWKKIKEVTSFVNRGTTPNYSDIGVMVVNQATFSKGKWDVNDVRYTSTKVQGNRGRLKREDVLMASTGGGVLGKLFYFNEPGEYVADSHVTIIRASDGTNSKYIYYQLYPKYDLINATLAKGSTNQTELQRQWLRDFYIPIPPKEEQDQIVRYLNWKTSEIDRFIHQKKKQIKKLEEYKFTKIDELITKGMNSHVQMKESGVEWLGQIPEHWDVHTIKQHFKVRKRIAGKEGYDVLSITQQGLKVKDISSNEGQMAMDYSGYQFVNPGDFAMNHMDLITGYVDLSDKFGVTSPDYRVFTLEDTDNCYPEFYLRVFQVAYKRRIFYKFGKGAANQGRWRLPQRAFYNYSIQIPPIEEQKVIEYECKQLEKNIDEMIEALKKEIDLLQELRTKIIADVVTGQIDVRDVVVPEYSRDEDTDSDDIEDDEEIEESED